MSLFVSGNGLLSKDAPKTVTLDLINLRDALFAPSDYYYNILRWKSIVLSLSSVVKSVSDQKIEVIFNRPSGETSQLSVQLQLSDLFLGTPSIDSLTIHDYDNGRYRILGPELEAADASYVIASDLPPRPTSEITDETNLSTPIVPNPEDWLVGQKVRVKAGSVFFNPATTIDAINTGTGEITLADPIEVAVVQPLKLQSPNLSIFEVLVSNDGVLSTEASSGTPNSPFRVKADKAQPEDADVFYSLAVDNEGVLQVVEDISNSTENNAFYLEAPDTSAWQITFSVLGQPVVKNEVTLVGKELVFAFDTELTVDQLIDFNNN